MEEGGGIVRNGHVRGGIEVFGFGDSLLVLVRFDLVFLEEEEGFGFDAMINYNNNNNINDNNNINNNNNSK